MHALGTHRLTGEDVDGGRGGGVGLKFLVHGGVAIQVTSEDFNDLASVVLGILARKPLNQLQGHPSE